MKKLLSLLLAVMMVISLCPITALADEVNPIELPQLIEQEEQQEELPEPAEEQPVEEQPAEEQEPQEKQGLNTIDFGNNEAAPAETNAEGSSEGWNGVTTKEPEKVDGVYQIGTAEELAWLSAKIDTGTQVDMSVVLTADIDMGNKNFMPIAEGREYIGVFDGQNHVVYNVLVETDSFGAYGGLFGVIAEDSTVKNLGVESITVKNKSENVRTTAGFCSKVSAGAKVENCYVKDVKIDAYSCYSFQGVGAGFCGDNAGEIKNCYVINGTVTDQCEKGDRNRAFVSTNTGMIENCYAANVTVNQTPAIAEYFGGEAKETKDENIKNCYILSADGIVSVNAAIKDEAWFKSAAAAMLGSAWKNDTEGKNNGFPMLKTEEDLNKPIPWDGNTKKEPEKVDGVYQIGTAEELAWLSAKIDTGTQVDMSVVLTADIDMGNKNFMPIADGGREYIGVFDGQNHVVYNVLVETDSFGAYGSCPLLTTSRRILSCTAS